MDKDTQIISKVMSIKRYAELKPVFEAIDFPYAVVKGEPLSIQAYGKPSQRLSGDVDILISRDDLTKLEDILRSHGFTSNKLSRADKVLMMIGSHQAAPWSKETSGRITVEVDVNFDIFWGEYSGKRADIAEFISDTIDLEVYGCRIKTLPPLKAMVQLLLHHYKEMNSIYHLAVHNCISEKMFRDVYYLIKNNTEDITLEKLCTICEKLGIIPYTYYVLYFTNRIYCDPELKKYADAFRTPEGEGLLEIYGLSESEKRPWKVDFDTRLASDDMFSLIKNDLTANDIKKLEINKRIFG